MDGLDQRWNIPPLERRRQAALLHQPERRIRGCGRSAGRHFSKQGSPAPLRRRDVGTIRVNARRRPVPVCELLYARTTAPLHGSAELASEAEELRVVWAPSERDL